MGGFERRANRHRDRSSPGRVY